MTKYVAISAFAAYTRFEIAAERISVIESGSPDFGPTREVIHDGIAEHRRQTGDL